MAAGNIPDYQYYKIAVEGIRLPAAILDLDSFETNAKSMLEKSGNFPIRVASKSIRSIEILRRIFDLSSQYRGILAYSAAEAAYLSMNGFKDIIIGYPSVESSDLRLALAEIKQGASIVFMICQCEQGALLSKLAREFDVQVNYCIDLDQSMPVPGVFFGVRRSRIRSPEEALKLILALNAFSNMSFMGFMGYEAQISGVGDAKPQKFLENYIVRRLKKLSLRQLKVQRRAIVEKITSHGYAVELFNGGGTGSLADSKLDSSLTELTAGSGFFSPALFDCYMNRHLVPAMFFALPVTRAVGRDWVTCHGGGYSASGSAGKDRLPSPFLPPGLYMYSQEGAGEVQTPLGGKTEGIKIGDPVFFRHAKAGEICEHFNEIHLLRNGKIIETVKTYRGDGMAFL